MESMNNEAASGRLVADVSVGPTIWCDNRGCDGYRAKRSADVGLKGRDERC